MGKKKVFLKKLGKIITAPVKFISKLPRETCRILDQGLDIGDKAIKKTGLNKVLGGASVGVSTSSGSRGGSNAYYKPAGSAHAVGAGLSNSGNASLFIDNNVAASLTTPKANFTERSTERIIIESDENHTINNKIAERDELLRETYGPGYIPESSLATIGFVAIGAAAKELYQDSIQMANAMSNLYLDTHVNIYSANEEQRAEAWTRNQELVANVEQAVSKVIQNPGIVATHYNNRAQEASNSFAAAYNTVDLIGAGKASGHTVYDVYTTSTAATGATALTAKAVSSTAKAANSFVATHKFRPPMVLQFNGTQLNSGIPLNNVKIQNPVVPKTAVVYAQVNQHLPLFSRHKEVYATYAQGNGVNLAYGGGEATINHINPTEVRSSQSTVSRSKTRVDPVTREKYTYTLDEIVSSMETNGWSGQPINVVKMHDGGLTAIDNTRLLAARKAGINAEIIIHDYNSKIPGYKYASKNVPPTLSAWGNFKAKYTSANIEELGIAELRLKYLRTSKRNDLPITGGQKTEIIAYAEKLGFPKDAIYFYEDMNISYGRMFGQERLHIGLDVLPAQPGMGKTANSRVSMKGAIAHEIVGHRAAELAGKVNPNILLEEAQASIRAARYAPDLNPTERFTLLKDAMERLQKAGISIKDVKHQLWIEPDALAPKLRGIPE